MSRAECKKVAKEIMKNNWIMGFVAVLIFALISGALGASTGGVGTIILGSSLTIAVYNVFISAYLGKGYEIEYMLKGHDKGLTNRIALSALKTLYIFLWSLLFIVPGIIKSYSYFLAEFISREHPDKSAQECIEESRKLMDGHKMELFVLNLSFLGWHLLSILTCGILYIWVLPYIYQTTVIYIDKNLYPLIDLDNEPLEAETIIKQSVRFCSNCGRSVEEGTFYCPNCGNKLR